MTSLQDQYAPNNSCFGCGPKNAQGLRIKSRAEGGELVADWTPEPHHEGFPGFLNGGIIGVLFDCHCNWTAAYHLMRQAAAERLPATVTADFSVKLLRPTPTGPVRLRAHVVESSGRRAVVDGTLEAAGEVTASCRGTFVAVKPDHPAYDRW